MRIIYIVPKKIGAAFRDGASAANSTIKSSFLSKFGCAALVMMREAAHIVSIASRLSTGSGNRETLLCSRPTKGASYVRHGLSDSSSEKLGAQVGKSRRS